MNDLRLHGIIGDKKSKGTAQPNTVLAGYTFDSASGNDQFGNIPVKTGQYGASGVSVGGGYINVDVPGAGYYPDDAILTIYDADYVASNVKKDSNLWGLIGTLLENELFAINPDIAFASGFQLTGIDKNYRYMSQAGQSSPTQAKYNHAGTLISNIRPADVPQTHYYATSHFSGGFTYHYNTALRIYDASGTLIRAITLAYAPPYSGQNFGYNGDKILLQEDGATEKVRYFNALGTYLGLLTLPIGYSVAFLTNPNKTIVVKYTGGNTARLYCKVGSNPVNINTNAELYEYLKMSI